MLDCNCVSLLCVADRHTVIPFGRVSALREYVAEAGREGGKAAQFWEWSEEQVKPYL